MACRSKCGGGGQRSKGPTQIQLKEAPVPKLIPPGTLLSSLLMVLCPLMAVHLCMDCQDKIASMNRYGWGEWRVWHAWRDGRGLPLLWFHWWGARAAGHITGPLINRPMIIFALWAWNWAWVGVILCSW